MIQKEFSKKEVPIMVDNILIIFKQDYVLLAVVAGISFFLGLFAAFKAANPFKQPKGKGYKTKKIIGENAITDKTVMKAYRMEKEGLSDEDIYKTLLQDKMEHHSNKDF